MPPLVEQPGGRGTERSGERGSVFRRRLQSPRLAGALEVDPASYSLGAGRDTGRVGLGRNWRAGNYPFGYDPEMAERFLLLWLAADGNINRGSIAPIRRAIEDQVSSPPDEVEIDVWLDSPGGDAHSAYKLALMLRAAASRVRVVIPDYAKSAATLLAISADEIYLAPGADLGPLDGQMVDEGSVSGSISALSIARAADEVARDAVQMAMDGGADLMAITGLSRAQTIEAMLTFSARFSEPLVCQLDPKVVHSAKQTLKVTAKYAELLLEEVGSEDPKGIAKALVETFPTHGYVISLKEAKSLGLPVRPIADYDLAGAVRAAVRQEEAGARLIHFTPMPDASQEPAKTAKKAPRKKKKGGGPK